GPEGDEKAAQPEPEHRERQPRRGPQGAQPVPGDAGVGGGPDADEDDGADDGAPGNLGHPKRLFQTFLAPSAMASPPSRSAVPTALPALLPTKAPIAPPMMAPPTVPTTGIGTKLPTVAP